MSREKERERQAEGHKICVLFSCLGTLLLCFCFEFRFVDNSAHFYLLLFFVFVFLFGHFAGASASCGEVDLRLESCVRGGLPRSSQGSLGGPAGG